MSAPSFVLRTGCVAPFDPHTAGVAAFGPHSAGVAPTVGASQAAPVRP
jgi:hypothetical protein